MDPGLPDRLRQLRRVLRGGSGVAGAAGDARAGASSDPDGGALAEALARVERRLDQDLLPRTAGGEAGLVVGLVGPNNAGKSALLNGLVGRAVSPSRPTGGATRRLVGVAHPELRARLEAEPALARFHLRGARPGREGVEEALVEASDPQELLLVDDVGLPPSLLLVDTPDFDSVELGNRAASEALLRVVDLALVVVTRHTYQNAEVVRFLGGWLETGRPWVLVYNEAFPDDVTREHARVLARDVGSAPEALFRASHDPAVGEGRAPLVATALEGAPEGTTLGDWLRGSVRTAELKRRALSASLAQLSAELAHLRGTLEGRRQRLAELERRIDEHTLRLGRTVAGDAMPLGIFLLAFRSVLDRRPGLLPTGYRGLLRRGRLALEGALARVVPGRRRAPEAGDGEPREPGVARAEAQLVEVEGAALERHFAGCYEGLERDLRGADPAPGGEGANGAEPARDPLREALLADLDPARLLPARRSVRGRLGDADTVLRAFRTACEELVSEELDRRGDVLVLQVAVDALHLLPAVAAGVVIVKTGGLGADMAVGGAGALSTLLAERLSRLLGTGVAQAARRRWTELEGRRVARLAREACLPDAGPRLESERERTERLGDALARVGGWES